MSFPENPKIVPPSPIQQEFTSTLPRLYATVNSSQPQEYWDPSTFEIQWSLPDNYEIVARVGGGKYSEVFEGRNIQTNEKCIIKVLKPIKERRIQKEVKILMTLDGGPNIIKLLDTVKDPESETMSLIFEYVNNTSSKVLNSCLSELEIRYYIYEILLALDYSHHKGIMHLDIKPYNIMIDHSQAKIRVIDWGLADFYLPNKAYNVRVASRCYKGPELLLNYSYYNYSLDMWSLGCMMAGLVFKKEPFFHGNDNYHQLLKIVSVLGTDDLYTYLNTYNIKLKPGFESYLGRRERIPWNHFINKENEHLCTPDAIDLINRMLVYNHNERILPSEAMKHSYFKSIMVDNKPQLIPKNSQ